MMISDTIDSKKSPLKKGINMRIPSVSTDQIIR